MTTQSPATPLYDLVITNGTIVAADAVYDADVAVVGERIAAIGHGLRGRRELSAAGCASFKLYMAYGPVSYTHLDVYKRQVLGMMGWLHPFRM